MMIKYQHVERLQMGEQVKEIDGLLDGVVWVFPKLDGANHCVWFDKDKNCVKCASRNQEQNEGWDSTGFYKYFSEHPELTKMAEDNPDFIFYGEFLTPHTIRDYQEGAYGKWYVFDVYMPGKKLHMPYNQYKDIENLYGVATIPPICTLLNPSFEDLMEQMDKATYLHGDKPGEGIVVKNYEFLNCYGRQIWGKIVRDEFKTNSKSKNKGVKETSFEEKIAEKYLSKDFVYKEAYKLIDETGKPWNIKRMPEILPIIWEEFIRDYASEFMMEYIKSSSKVVDLDALHRAVNRQAAYFLKRFMVYEV